MADSTIDSELIILRNNWGVAPSTDRFEPTDGFAEGNAVHHNSATAEFSLGTVAQVYNKGTAGKAGPAQFIYLLVGTQNSANVLAAKDVVVQGSATVPFTVTNDPDSAVIKLPTGLAAICLSAMTNAYYGWFWCGGSCPEDFVSGLAGDYLTDDDVVIGAFCAHDLDADAIGFGPSLDATGSVQEGVFGFALADDT